MLFGGLQKVTLVDYPGKIAATVFTVGCNFFCPFCHNPELVDPELIKTQPLIEEKEILDFLKERKDYLQALCITGGEPTLQKDLKNFIKKVKKLGYLVKLDTNGSNPQVLKELLKENLIDFIAMDIKAPFNKYHLFTKEKDFTKEIKESIELIKNSKIDYEFRTTLDPLNLTKEDILKIAELIKGSKAYYLQQFHNYKTLNKDYKNLKPIEDKEILEILEKIKPFFEVCGFRQ